MTKIYIIKNLHLIGLQRNTRKASFLRNRKSFLSLSQSYLLLRLLSTHLTWPPFLKVKFTVQQIRILPKHNTKSSTYETSVHIPILLQLVIIDISGNHADHLVRTYAYCLIASSTISIKLRHIMAWKHEMERIGVVESDIRSTHNSIHCQYYKLSIIYVVESLINIIHVSIIHIKMKIAAYLKGCLDQPMPQFLFILEFGTQLLFLFNNMKVNIPTPALVRMTAKRLAKKLAVKRKLKEKGIKKSPKVETKVTSQPQQKKHKVEAAKNIPVQEPVEDISEEDEQIIDEVEKKEEVHSEEAEQDSQELLPLGDEPKNNNFGDKSAEELAWYFSDKKFREFELSEPTQKSLEFYNYNQMTHIQARTLPYLLKGRDVLGAAKTGSGKTLAYLIPCFELLYRFEFKQKNGTGVIVITPTRELAIQVYEVAKKVGHFHNKTIGLLMGGMNRKAESIRLEKGVNLLICTPGRLLDHLQNSKFIYHNLLSLVIDEADALLRQGFEEDLSQILKAIPKERQTILFSATQTQKVDELAKLSLRDPIYIGVDDEKAVATVNNLEQGFVIIEANKKFQLLFTFLQKQKGKKIMVFFSSCNSVKFYSDLLNYVDISVMDIHGKQKQQKRSTTFYEFGQLKTGILLCTDVAARGLDIPEVDWIVQFDPPLDIKEYIHRVGRTCRGYKSSGKALLFLLPEEEGYLKHLVHSKVELNHYEFSDDKLVSVQEQFETLIEKNHFLHTEAMSAFKSYLHAYTTYGLKQVFNVHTLDLKKVAAGFGLKKPPHVELNVKLGGSKVKRVNRMGTKNQQ